MSESRSINSGKNVFWSYFNIVFGMLMSFISRTVFIRTLGIEFLSINGLFSNLLTILSLADLGFGTAMAYSYYKPIAEDNTKKIIELNCFYRIVYRYIAIGITIIGVIISPALPQIVNLDQEINNLYLYYFLTLAGVVSSYFVVYKSTLITAYQKNYIILKHNSIVKFFTTIFQIILMILTKNYVVYLLVVLLSNVINNFRISLIADRMFPFLKQKGELTKNEKKNVFNNIKSVFIYKISGVLINGTDNILISTLVGTVWVGYYSNYLIIVNNITSFVNAIFTSMTASIGNLIVKEDFKKRYNTFKILQIISFWISCTVIPCFFVLITPFVRLWLGNDFLLDGLSVVAITFNLYLTCVLQPIWIYREATGIYVKIKYVMLSTAVLNIFLSIWWGYCFGVSGILLASAVAKLLTYVWLEPVMLFREFFNRKGLEFLIFLGMNFLIILFECILLTYIMNIFKVDSWISFFVSGIICFLITNILFLICSGKNKYFVELLCKIKFLIRRKYHVQK